MPSFSLCNNFWGRFEEKTKIMPYLMSPIENMKTIVILLRSTCGHLKVKTHVLMLIVESYYAHI